MAKQTKSPKVLTINKQEIENIVGLENGSGKVCLEIKSVNWIYKSFDVHSRMAGRQAGRKEVSWLPCLPLCSPALLSAKAIVVEQKTYQSKYSALRLKVSQNGDFQENLIILQGFCLT